MEPTVIFVAAGVALLIGLSKGGFGGTLGALATPLLALVMPADQVIGLLLPILMVADIFAVAFHWGHWQGRLVILLVPGAVVGVTIGTFFLTHVPAETLQLLLGIIILLLALYKLFERRLLSHLVYQPRDWHGVVAGTVAGFSSAVAHTGGPPITVYLLFQKISPRVFIATSALFFAILNWIKVPYYFYAGLFDFELLRQMSWMLPLVVVGVWLGRKTAGKIDPQTYEQLIGVLLLLSAFILILE